MNNSHMSDGNGGHGANLSAGAFTATLKGKINGLEETIRAL